MTLPFGTCGEKVHDASTHAADNISFIRDRFIFISLRT